MRTFNSRSSRKIGLIALLTSCLVIASVFFVLSGRMKVSAQTDTTTPSVIPPTTPARFWAVPNMCGTGLLNIFWSVSDSATGYRLTREGTQVYDGTNTHYYYSPGILTPGTAYSFSIVAYNQGGDSSPYTISATSPVCIPVAAPTGFSVTSQTPGSVSLQWTETTTNVDHFSVERTSTHMGWIVKSVPGTGTSYTDSGVISGTTYDYRIHACMSTDDISNCSDYTNLTGVMVSSGGSIPNIPYSFTASASSQSAVVLSWQNSGAIPDHFNISRKLHTDTDYTYSTTTWMANGTSFTDYGSFQSGLTYDYKMDACLSGNGCSSNTNGQYAYTSVTIPTSSNSGGTPAAPTNLQATAGQTSVSLQWQNSPAYQNWVIIYRKISGTGSFVSVGQTSNASQNTFSDTPSSSGSYDYQIVSCYSTAQCSSSSNTSSVTYTYQSNNSSGSPSSGSGTVSLTTPTGFSVASAPMVGNIALKWDSMSGASYYKLERRSTSASSYTYAWQPTMNSFYDQSVTASTTYYYHVAECTSSSCSPFTADLEVRTPAAAATSAPTQPIGFSYTTGICSVNSVSLSWQIATSADVYRIYRGSSLIYTTTNRAYTDTNLSPATIYSYYLFAVNSVGTSTPANLSAATAPLCTSGYSSSTLAVANSSTTSSVTAVAAPTNLRVNSSSTPNAIALLWTDNAINEDKFNLERKLSNTTAFGSLQLLWGSNITSYTDTTAAPDISYDYRVQACLTGTGCSGYAYLYGVTALSSNLATSSKSVTTTTGNLTSTNTNIITKTLTSENISTSSSASNQTIITTPIPKSLLEPPSVQSAPVALATSTQGPSVLSTSSPEILQMTKIADVIEDTKTAINDTKKNLINIVDQNIQVALNQTTTTANSSSTEQLATIRDDLVNKIDTTLVGVTTITPEKINDLAYQINSGLKDIHVAVSGGGGTSVSVADTKNVSRTLESLTNTVQSQAQALKAQGGDLLYKDSNNDGISDYDSAKVYRMDPAKPSPVSVYEGKKINAEEKILLGFDPSKKDLVKVSPEDPNISQAPTVPVYKVSEVKLDTTKKVTIKGEALPNSFVTVYVYSTPIVVTVKADSNGEWQYTLDRELTSGKHTVYTATVNNSGRILAKSSPFNFTKTAEAATLNSILPAPVVTNSQEPSLFTTKEVYIFSVLVLCLAVLVLFIVGKGTESRQKKDS